jgi:hypothetical protein
MEALTMTGSSAVLKWGYREAAVLGAWSMTGHTAGGGSLTATVISSDTFRVTQTPLTFVHPNGKWTYPVLDLQITDHTLTALLGP